MKIYQTTITEVKEQLFKINTLTGCFKYKEISIIWYLNGSRMFGSMNKLYFVFDENDVEYVSGQNRDERSL